jgi:hypothetical protein
VLLVSVGLAVGLVVDVKVVADDVDDRDDLAFDIAAEARRLSLCALVRRVLTGVGEGGGEGRGGRSVREPRDGARARGRTSRGAGGRTGGGGRVGRR